MTIQNPQSCPIGRSYFYDDFSGLNSSKWNGAENVVDSLLYDSNSNWLVYHKNPAPTIDEYVEIQLVASFKFRQGAYFGINYPILSIGDLTQSANFVSLKWKQDNSNNKYSINLKTSAGTDILIYTCESSSIETTVLLKLRIYSDQIFAYADGIYVGKGLIDSILEWKYAIQAGTTANDFSKIDDFYIVGNDLDVSCAGEKNWTRLDLETQSRNLKDANISEDAHISYSKLNLTGKIVDDDLSTGKLHLPEDTTALKNKKVLNFQEFKNVQTGAAHSSVNISSLLLSQERATSGGSNEGFIVDAPLNKVTIVNAATKAIIVDSFKNEVFGRLTYSSSVWTLLFYSVISNVETLHEFVNDTALNIYIVKRENLQDVTENFIVSRSPVGGSGGGGADLQEHIESSTSHGADSITVAFIPSNYVPSANKVESHLESIDAALSLIGGTAPLGTPSDGSFSGGLLDFTNMTHINDAIDSLNGIMVEIAPAQALPLTNSDMQIYNTSTVKYVGYLSAGNAYYEGVAGDSVNHIIADATFTLETLSTTFNWADTGILKLQINGVQVDSYNLGLSFNESLRDGNQTYVPSTSLAGFITVVSVGKFNNFKKWQKGVARINIIPANLRQGYNYIKLIHEMSGNSQESNSWKCFYDNDSGANPSVSVPTLAQSSVVSNKYLSGVQYYSTNDQFYVNVIGNDLFDNTYVLQPLRISMTALTTLNISLTDGNISPPLPTVPSINTTLNLVNKVVTILQTNQATNDLRVTVTPISPYGTHTAQLSISNKMLLNTYGNYSTDTKEYFYDENYRLPDNDGSLYPNNYNVVPSPRTGKWNAFAAITNASGESQVYNGKCVYPSTNFTNGYFPTQVANYSSFMGDKIFVRSFYKVAAFSSGTITLTGLTLANISAGGKAKVEIKLPSKTGWLDLGKPFDSGTFAGVNGDGCRTSVTGSNFSWSSGSFSTSTSGNMIILRVTIKQDASPCEVTYIELI